MLKQRRAKKLAAKSIHLQYKDPFGIRQTGIDIFGDGSQQQDLNMTAGTPILESRVLPGRDGLKSTARNIRSGTPELEQVTSKEWTVARSRFTDKFHRSITECKNDGLKRILRVANRRVKLDKPKRPKFIELDSVKKEVSKWNRSIEPSSIKQQQQQQQQQRRRNKKIYKKKHVDKILNDNSFIVLDEVYQEPKKVRRKPKVKPTKRVETIIPESPAIIRNERKIRKHDTLTTIMDLLEKFVLSDKLHESSPVIVNNYVQSKYFSRVHIFEEYFVDYFEAISKRMLFSVICSCGNELELIEWIRLVQELQDYPIFKDQVEYFTSKLRIILEFNNLQSHSELATLFIRLLLYGSQDETFLRDLFKKCWSDVSLLAAENAISEDQLELYIKFHDGISIDLIYRMIQEIVKSQDSSMVLNLKRICGYYLLLKREERILELVFDYILKPEIRKTPLDFIKINETVSTIIQHSNQVSPFGFSVIQMNMQNEIPKEEVFSLVENIIFRNDNESECSRLFRSFCQLLFSIPGITCNLYDIAPLVSVHSNNNTISAINERDKLKNWNRIFGKVFGIMKASISNYAVYSLGLLFLGSLSNNVAILKSFFIYFDYLDKIVDYTSELLFVYGICVTVLIKQIVWLNADVSAAVKSHLIEKILKSPKSANFMKTKYYCCILRYVLNEDMILDSLFKQQDRILVKDFLFLLKPSLTTTTDHNEDMTVKNSVLQLILALSRKGQLHLGDYFVEFMRELLQTIFSKDQIKDKEQILLLETAAKVVVNIVPSIMKNDLRLFVEKFGPYSNLSGNYGYRNPMFREFSLTVLCEAFRVVSWRGSFDIVYLLRFLAERLVDFLVIEKSSYKSQLIQYISSLQSLLSQKNDYVQLHLGMKPSVDLLTTTSSFEEFLYVFRVLLNFMKTSKSVNVQKTVFGNVLKILLMNWKECDGRVWLELNYRKKTFDLLLDLIHSLPTLFSVYELERLLRNNCSGKDRFSDHLYAFWWSSYILTSNIGTELKLLRNLHEFFVYYLITSPTTNNSFFFGFIEALCSKKNPPSSTSVQCELFFNCFLRNWMQNELNLKNAGYFLSILEWFIDKLRLTPEVREENLSIILEHIVQSFTCIMEYFLSNEIMLSTGFLNYSVQLLCKIVRLNGSLYNFRSELNQSYEFASRFLLYSYAALQEEHAEKAEIMSLCNSFKESRSHESNISRLVSQLELSLKHELSFCPLMNDDLGRSMDPCKVYMIPMINLKDRTIYALQSTAALNFTMKLSIDPLLNEMLQDTQSAIEAYPNF